MPIKEFNHYRIEKYKNKENTLDCIVGGNIMDKRELMLFALIFSLTLSLSSSAFYIYDNRTSLDNFSEDYSLEDNITVPLESPLSMGIFLKVKEREENEPDYIHINLSYNNGTNWNTDNDGVESIKGVVDLTVNQTDFSLDLNHSNLCTKWIVLSEDTGNYEAICFGSKKACNFLYLDSQEKSKWNDPLFVHYGRYGATSNNTVSAQVFYIDYSTEIDDLHADIYESDLDSLPVLFTEE